MSQNLNLRRRWTAPVVCGLLAGLYLLPSVRAQTAPSSFKPEAPTSAAPEPASEAAPADEIDQEVLPDVDPEPLPEEAELAPEADATAIAEGHELAEVTLTVYPIEFAPGELPLPEPPVRVGSFNIMINPGATLAGNAAALAAFNRAAAAWESFFSDPITVTINADLADLGGGGVIGITNSVALEVTAPYSDLRTVWIASADGDDGILSFLPTAANRAFTVNTGYSLSATTLGLKATLKAMGGFGDLDGTLGATDATITFNTQFTFDYDNSNGVGVGLVDFETTAAHEIGHALGFVSSTDIVDERIHNGQPAIAIYPSLLDYFRFLDGPPSDPATALNFSTYGRELRTSQNAITDFIFAVANEGVENRMSTGKWTGDGRQASHWKDDALTGTRLGIMDPTLPAQAVWTISHADVRALDLIGYDVVLDDCNNNGFDDDDDIFAGTSEDCNANGTPDECDPPVLDQSNLPAWAGTATNILPGTNATQTFQPGQPVVTAVGIALFDAQASSDTVTVSILVGGMLLESKSRLLTAPTASVERFTFDNPVATRPGETLELRVQGTGANVFWWKYAGDTYPNGQRFVFGAPQANDWLFQTYGADAAPSSDCDRNGVPDECDPNCDGDGVPDACEFTLLDQRNLPLWGGGWLNILPSTNATQTFQPEVPLVTAVDIALFNAPSSSETVTVSILRGGVLLRSKSRSLTAPVASLERFTFDTPVAATPGETLQLRVQGSGANVFGWKNAGNTYPNGQGFSGGIPQAWDFLFQTYGTAGAGGPSNDCNANSVPDECELAGNDCNVNGTPDECDLAGNDCNGNGTPDGCELAGNDCNANGMPDGCDLTGNDCNGNALPDECEPDCNANGAPDDCDLVVGHNCCATGHGAGCSDPGIAACVCAVDPYCCNFDWDSICAGEVQSLGCGSCGPASNDCNANATPDECDLAHNCCATGHGTGCSHSGIQACVCAVDPYCCNVDWDSICAGEVQGLGCGNCGGASDDCNANGVPDECDGGCVPAATVTGAVSRKTNPGGPGSVCDLALQPATQSEPRQGGLTEVRIAFDVPPGGPGASPVTLEQATCAAPAYTPYAGASTSSASVAGSTLVVTFSPGLENGRTYRLNLGGAVTSIAGQFVEVSGLTGDVNGDGFTNAVDRSVLVGLWTGASHFSCGTDLNSDGSTNAIDRSIVVGAWTGGQNCAP